MARETIEEKALRYIAEGRVDVVLVFQGDALAKVQGSGDAPYEVRWTGTAWRCPCEARVSECAHVVATKLVVKMAPSASLGSPALADEDLFEMLEGGDVGG